MQQTTADALRENAGDAGDGARAGRRTDPRLAAPARLRHVLPRPHAGRPRAGRAARRRLGHDALRVAPVPPHVRPGPARGARRAGRPHAGDEARPHGLRRRARHRPPRAAGRQGLPLSDGGAQAHEGPGRPRAVRRDAGRRGVRHARGRQRQRLEPLRHAAPDVPRRDALQGRAARRRRDAPGARARDGYPAGGRGAAPRRRRRLDRARASGPTWSSTTSTPPSGARSSTRSTTSSTPRPAPASGRS